MVIKKDKKLTLTVKNAFIEDEKLIDAESGDSLDIPGLVSKIFNGEDVKITIAATTSEEVELESNDSEE